MRAVLLSRYPRVDTMAWKRRLGERLVAGGYEVSVLYTRSSLGDQLRAGLQEFGLQGTARRYLAARRPGPGQSSRQGASETLTAWSQARGLEVRRHDRLSSAATLDALRELAPDVLVLAGADIVPPKVLEVPARCTINAHYGLLPAYRGMNVTEWSIWHDDPVGVSVHAVDPGIDTGDLLLREEIPVAAGETLKTLRARHQEVAARLLGDAVEALAAGTEERTPQAPGEGRQFYRMHPALRRRVETRLATGTYPPQAHRR